MGKAKVKRETLVLAAGLTNIVVSTSILLEVLKTAKWNATAAIAGAFGAAEIGGLAASSIIDLGERFLDIEEPEKTEESNSDDEIIETESEEEAKQGAEA